MPSSTVSNVPTASISESLQGPIIPTCVFLHNRTAVMMEIEDTPTATCDLMCQAIVNSDELGLNKQLASQVFTLWMVSPLLGEYYLLKVVCTRDKKVYVNSSCIFMMGKFCGVSDISICTGKDDVFY